jgi:hypothetical protein
MADIKSLIYYPQKKITSNPCESSGLKYVIEIKTDQI